MGASLNFWKYYKFLLLGSSWSNYFVWGVARGCHDEEAATATSAARQLDVDVNCTLPSSIYCIIICTILSIIFSCSRCRSSHLSIQDEVYWRDLEQQSRCRWVHHKVAPHLKYTSTVPKLCSYKVSQNIGPPLCFLSLSRVLEQQINFWPFFNSPGKLLHDSNKNYP